MVMKKGIAKNIKLQEKILQVRFGIQTKAMKAP